MKIFTTTALVTALTLIGASANGAVLSDYGTTVRGGGNGNFENNTVTRFGAFGSNNDLDGYLVFDISGDGPNTEGTLSIDLQPQAGPNTGIDMDVEYLGTFSNGNFDTEADFGAAWDVAAPIWTVSFTDLDAPSTVEVPVSGISGAQFAVFRINDPTANNGQEWNVGPGDSTNTTLTLDAVPEPSSLALLGLGGLLVARRRRA